MAKFLSSVNAYHNVQVLIDLILPFIHTMYLSFIQCITHVKINGIIMARKWRVQRKLYMHACDRGGAN